VVVGDQFAAVVAGPVEQFLTVNGGQIHAVAFLNVNRERVWLGDDVIAHFEEH
jgi:hypothetical protein